MTNEQLASNLNRHQRKVAFIRAARAADNACAMAARLSADANTADDYNAVLDALLVAAAAVRNASDAAALYRPDEDGNDSAEL